MTRIEQEIKEAYDAGYRDGFMAGESSERAIMQKEFDSIHFPHQYKKVEGGSNKWKCECGKIIYSS